MGSCGGVIGMPWIYRYFLKSSGHSTSSSTRKFHSSTRLRDSQTVQHVESVCPSFETCHVKSWPKKSASGHCISPTRLSYLQDASKHWCYCPCRLQGSPPRIFQAAKRNLLSLPKLDKPRLFSKIMKFTKNDAIICDLTYVYKMIKMQLEGFLS